MSAAVADRRLANTAVGGTAGCQRREVRHWQGFQAVAGGDRSGRGRIGDEAALLARMSNRMNQPEQHIDMDLVRETEEYRAAAPRISALLAANFSNADMEALRREALKRVRAEQLNARLDEYFGRGSRGR